MGNSLVNYITNKNFIKNIKKDIVLIIILIGLSLRIFCLFYALPIPVSDFKFYYDIAIGIIRYGQIGYPEPTTYVFPIYPIFLATFILGNNYLWLEFLNCLLSTSLIYLVYLVGKQKHATIGLIAALLIAFNPQFIFFSPQLCSEFLWGIFILSAYLTKNNFTSGFLWGLSILTRGEGIFYIPILFRFKVWFVVGTLIILPWVIRNYRLNGSLLSTRGGVNFYFAHSEKYGYRKLEKFNGDAETDKKFYKLGFKYIKENPKSILTSIKLGTKELFKHHSYSLYWLGNKSIFVKFDNYVRQYWKYLAFLAIGALFWIKKYKEWYFFVIMNWVCYTVIFWGKARYRFTSELFISLLAAAFIWQIIKFVGSHVKNKSRKNFSLVQHS